MSNDKVADVSNLHPARLVPFADLHENLMRECAAGNVAFKTKGPLMLFTYTQQCVYDKRWSLWSLMARGLILDVDAGEVVATPFPKFFNFGEADVRQQDLAVSAGVGFSVTEKMDGSLGIIYWHDGDWRVATKGSFQSDQARWAEKWLGKIDLDAFSAGTTYLVEIIYPENRIVIPYGFDDKGFVLLSAYDETGRELGRPELDVVVRFASAPIALRLVVTCWTSMGSSWVAA